MVRVRHILFVLAIPILLLFHHNKQENLFSFNMPPEGMQARSPQIIYNFTDTIKISDFFKVMDSLVDMYDTLLTYPVTEHLIIRYNPWVIDSLAATDYYLLKERGIINLDPKELPVFIPGQYLIIPDSSAVDSLNRVFKQTSLDINIPEFKLRVMLADSLIREFPVRVGRNESRYLAMTGRVTNLRTLTGEGIILRHIKNPDFINPVNNRIYRVTRRDDGVVTALPNIPWLETEIDGERYGQLIHPTTNIETLGKAVSNGCIGTSEAAGWVIYYLAPAGSRIAIRYDLDVIDNEGNTIKLPNIYNL
jgi:L,D-transpeptidase ErfK/SrfK